MLTRRRVAPALALALAGCELPRTGLTPRLPAGGEFELERLTVFFGVASDLVDEVAEATLRELAGRLRERPPNDVAVEGYAEADGPPGEGLGLSEGRAIAVARRLTAHGVPAELIRTMGMGMVEPMALSLEGRRADITVQWLPR